MWQNRFYSSVLGGSHLGTALAYVDLNPVRAGLVRRPEEHEWSSAKAHPAGCAGDPLIDSWAWEQLGLAADWAERLAAHQAAGGGEQLHEATYGGRPFGDAKFISEMERKVKRPLRKGRLGPKPKAAHAAASA